MKRLLAVLGTLIKKNTGRTPEPSRSCNVHPFALFLGCLLVASLLVPVSRGYGGTDPIVSTDKSDYPPGSTAEISGAGFQPGETVVLQVLHADGTPSDGADHNPWLVLADADGAFQGSWHVCEDDCVGSTLALSASGQTSGLSAEAFFTDAGPNAGGELDPTLYPGSSVNDSVRSAIVLPDGRILIAGYFTTVNGAVPGRIARLNADGSTDSTFQSGLAGANNGIQSAVLQTDGKILICGFFTAVNGATRTRVARLNSDGSLDTTFLNPVADAQVNSIAVQPDGKVLIVGSFANVGGIPRAGLARLNSDGSLDPSFLNGMSGANNGVLSVAVQPDGRILIGGFFTIINNVAHTGLARLNSDGSVDTSFLDGMNGPQGAVYSIVLQPDGKVLIGGNFLKVNFNIDGAVQPVIARLNPDGSRDTSFVVTGAPRFQMNLDPGRTIFSIVVQPNGDILYGGSVQSPNGDVQGFFGRLNSGGLVDFDVSLSPPPQIVTGNAVNQTVNAIALQPDGKMLLGGDFITTDSIMPRNRIARVNSDGSLDTAFQNGPAGPERTVRSVVVQANGKILIAGNFVGLNGDTTLGGGCARLNIDGSRDRTFPGLSGATNTSCSAVAIQPDCKVLVAGSFFLTREGISRIGRFNSDGSVDFSFSSSPGAVDNIVNALALQPDGKVLIGGGFSNVGFLGRNRIARLNSDGSLDAAFLDGLAGANNTINSIALQPDGKVLIGGAFTSVNGVGRNRLARLNDDGTLDTTFLNGLAGANNVINSVALQPDGKVLVGGTFTSVNGTGRNRLARLNSNGTLDTTFLNGKTGGNNTINSILLQSNGKVLIGGLFTSVNGVGRNRIARLTSDGSIDTTFQNGMSGANSSVFSIALQPDGNVVIGGDLTIINGVASDKVARLIGEPVVTTPTPPAIACPQNVTVTAEAGQCSAVVNYLVTAQPVSPCSEVTIFCTPPSGSAFPRGTTPVNCVAIDTLGGSATCSFTVTVLDNEPPIITCPANITVTAAAGACEQRVLFTVSARDNCADVIASCNPPSGATFPKGITTVSCIATDTSGNTARCSFTVTVNTTPMANPLSLLTTEDSPVSLTLSGSHCPGDTTTFAILSAPAQGELAGTPPNLIYTPGPSFQALAEGESGADSFTYTISDGNGGTATAVVSITITGVNDAPVALADNAVTDENTTLILSAATLLANDTDLDTHDTLSIISLDSTGTLGTVAFNADGTISYVPAAAFQALAVGETASDSFSYTISDGHGGAATAQVHVTITGVNDSPVAVPDTATMAEDSRDNFINVLANDTDIDTSDTRTVTAVTAPAHGTSGFTPGGVAYSPATNYYGSDSFTYTISDGHGGTAVGTVNVTVTPVNDAPVANNGAATTPEDTQVEITLAASDIENDPLNFAIVQAPLHGTLSAIAGNKVTYTPALNYNGPDSFTFKANDGAEDSNAGTVSITVNPVDDAPVLMQPDDQTNFVGASVSLQLAGSDPENDPLTYSATGLPPGLVLNPQTGLISGTTQGSSNAVYHVAVSVSDGTYTDSKTFVWSIINPNHPPVASNGAAATTQNTAVQVTMVASDPDGDTLTYSILNGPSHGALGPVNGNKVVYTPAATFSGADSFTFQVNDAKGGVATATVTITVSGPPPSNPGEKVTGGGTINGKGGKSNFGFEVLVTGDGRLQGNLTYHDPGSNEDVKATSITALTVSSDCKHGRIYGVASINGQGAYNFVADVDDLAEPGANVDAFHIQLGDGYLAGGTVTTGGNIQVHCKK